jgi:hypothetical protein
MTKKNSTIYTVIAVYYLGGDLNEKPHVWSFADKKDAVIKFKDLVRNETLDGTESQIDKGHDDFNLLEERNRYFCKNHDTDDIVQINLLKQTLL